MSIDLPGFADPVSGSQSCFRATLEAMSRPGSLHQAGAGLTPPAPLDPATAGVLLTLVDTDTRLWLAPDCAAAAEWIAFHCGAAAHPAIGEADFVLATALPDLATLNAGTDSGPEESATVVLQVRGFGAGQALRLAGPGLREPTTLSADGLPEGFAAAWAANHALFPRGVDIILCAGTTIAALPRSLQITEA
ncbi:MAG TPA: phosphonate C-P lyase system protein PhnH [Acetobacteraceae bacterium]|jgi:alpha-D-ribose 1-methylphosphonate 5-triphosphate synthase subunit PhnH